MRNKTRQIENLKLEIQDMEDKVKSYEESKPAFARRLNMILSRKKQQLKSWILNERN